MVRLVPSSGNHSFWCRFFDAKVELDAGDPRNGKKREEWDPRPGPKGSRIPVGPVPSGLAQPIERRPSGTCPPPQPPHPTPSDLPAEYFARRMANVVKPMGGEEDFARCRKNESIVSPQIVHSASPSKNHNAPQWGNRRGRYDGGRTPRSATSTHRSPSRGDWSQRGGGRGTNSALASNVVSNAAWGSACRTAHTGRETTTTSAMTTDSSKEYPPRTPLCSCLAGPLLLYRLFRRCHSIFMPTDALFPFAFSLFLWSLLPVGLHHVCVGTEGRPP